jgi:threonine dehydrogenase-like Zn-dependent dehydrogenase
VHHVSAAGCAVACAALRAVVIEAFGQEPRVVEVPDPAPPAHGVVVAVEATGVCRSDWHAWQGHGMAAHDYPRLLALVRSGRFPLDRLLVRTLPLDAGPRGLAEIGTAAAAGVTVLLPAT